MQKKVHQNKDFRTLFEQSFSLVSTAMQYPKSISELLRGPHKRLDDLGRRLDRRDAALVAVRAALPQELAAQIASAGCEGGRLSVGVASAAWASRMRYALAEARTALAAALGEEIGTIRVLIVPPGPPR